MSEIEKYRKIIGELEEEVKEVDPQDEELEYFYAKELEYYYARLARLEKKLF